LFHRIADKARQLPIGGVSTKQSLLRHKAELRFWLFPEWTGLADFSKRRIPDTFLSPLSTPDTKICDKYAIEVQGHSPYTST